jgi:two-component system, LytTR family, sensor kinase
MVTQITGLLLSLVICYILQDFTWGFVRMALVNSFILGLSLIGSCYLSQSLMFKIKTIYIVAISFSLVLGISIISLFIVLFLEPTLFIYYDRGAFSFLFVNFLFIIALYSIGSGLIIYREIMVEKEKAIGNERYLRNQMEMKLLSARVNPHFLFNTLNMVLTLLKQPAKAETAILNLSDLLRENLEQSDKMSIPVKQELANVGKYLEIQKLRFGEKLQYEIKGDADFSIPPLIIQPLVENSIKHNMQKVSHLTIEILLTRHDERNTITISDSEKAVQPSMLNQGQGLTITKKRVENGGGTFLIENGGVEISFGL